MEEFEVLTADEAKKDLQNIVSQLEFDAANQFLDAFEAEVESLETMPERYARVLDDYLARIGYRMTIIKPYLVFYVVDRAARQVTIIRLLHWKTNWMESLKADL